MRAGQRNPRPIFFRDSSLATCVTFLRNGNSLSAIEPLFIHPRIRRQQSGRGVERAGVAVGKSGGSRAVRARQRSVRRRAHGRRKPRRSAPAHRGEGRRSRPISRVLSRAVIPLRCASPRTCSDLPGSSCGLTQRSPIRSCSKWGLPCRRVLPPARCALTAPFHPYLPLPAGGLFSVALSVGSRLPGVTWHSAQSSPDFPPGLAPQRLLGRLRRQAYRNRAGERSVGTGQVRVRR